jgi:hypothetical protein
MQSNIYLELTQEFNRGRLRGILSSGQAVVLHRLAVMSKDGDWIIREDEEALEHILGVLESRGAKYRFGAPLALPWLAGGWSAHFEFTQDRYSPSRVRTDFVSRPPRVTKTELAELWKSEEANFAPDTPPFVDLVTLARLKQTNRDRDYAVIGELARRMEKVEDQLLFSRSADEILDLAAANPGLASQLGQRRPLLKEVSNGEEALESALDAERRRLTKINEDRLANYASAARRWLSRWPEFDKHMASLSLREAHAYLVEQASLSLPQNPLN